MAMLFVRSATAVHSEWSGNVMSIRRTDNKQKAFMLQFPDMVKRAYTALWPLSPLALFYLLGIALFTAFRALLCLSYYGRLREVPNWLMVFPIGLRLDTVLLCYVMVIPALVLLVCPARLKSIACWLTTVYFACMAALFYFLEVATFPFMAEFENRPDRLFIEHMVQIREVSEMILKGYAGILCIGLSGMALIAAAVMWGFRKVSGWNRPCGFIRRLGMFFFIAPLLYIGIRSNLSGRPVNLSIAAFSECHLVNQLGFNSTYSLGYTYVQMQRNAESSAAIYGNMPKNEVFQRLLAANGVRSKDCTNPGIPLLHFQKSGFSIKQPLNLVIIMEESIGAEHVGCLGGLPLTPRMDKLSREGLLFKNLYCTGTRTVRGIEAVIAGFLPTPGESVLKNEIGQQKFFTIAELLKRQGYSTDFLYGGKSTFDNMRACFRSNGFDTIHDQDDFKNPVFTSTWGVSDEDLFARANDVFRNHADKPFFALVLTTSNHDPYEFPDGRIELYEQPKASRYNTIKYADFALGNFFETAKKEAYYGRTVFLVIADHGTRLRGQSLIPIQKYHIPGLIIAPHLRPGTYEKTASQIDMTPTLLDIMGISTDLPLIGRPLLSISENMPGRAIMQYGNTHALLVDSSLVVQQPEKEPVQFTCAGEQLKPCQLDADLARDAIAYALLPDYLAAEKLHRLP
jgi:phosphoglycerol transferase MdoB-like AlkP superfamily enzyme